LSNNGSAPLSLNQKQISMKEHGPWKITSTNEIYRDPFVNLKVDQVIRPDGDPGQHVVVGIKPGVCVLALDDQGNARLRRSLVWLRIE